MNSKRELMTSRQSSVMTGVVSIALIVAVICSVVVGTQLFQEYADPFVTALSGMGLAISISIIIYALINPDVVRANQSDAMLKLARQTFASVRDGLGEKSAQKVCSLLIPNTNATDVLIANREKALGICGDNLDTVLALSTRVLEHRKSLSSPNSGLYVATMSDTPVLFYDNPHIHGVIVVPLLIGRHEVGTVHFYYRRAWRINETQMSIAEGFGHLLSTQLSAQQLEQQTQLATSMELKALQNQINPHFLFNTINTIASLIRTDPMKARTLLREFAIFYRRTLENADGLILLSREAEQTVRYFDFEVARFGEDRVELILEEEDGVEDMLVPPFLLQPIVENAVRHAMPSEGKLVVRITACIENDNLKIRVIDNGVGMSKETCENIMHPESSTGMGIAVKNVHDRMLGYFGPDAKMEVESELGKGTTVTFTIPREPKTLFYND